MAALLVSGYPDAASCGDGDTFTIPAAGYTDRNAVLLWSTRRRVQGFLQRVESLTQLIQPCLLAGETARPLRLSLPQTRFLALILRLDCLEGLGPAHQIPAPRGILLLRSLRIQTLHLGGEVCLLLSQPR